MENEQDLKRSKEARLLEWLLSEDWVIADSHTHVAVDIVEIQRSFVAHFPDAPVLDSGDEERLLEKAGECILAVLTKSSVTMTPYDINEMQNLIVQILCVRESDSGDEERLIEYIDSDIEQYFRGHNWHKDSLTLSAYKETKRLVYNSIRAFAAKTGEPK